MKIVSQLLLSLLLLTPLTVSLAADASEENPLVVRLRHRALPLETERDLDPLLRRAANARLALLGDASHGTYDFYRVRAHISQRLISEQEISFMAVEGDWESAAELDRYVRDLPGAAGSAAEALRAFDRWPQWVWNNAEMARLAEWLRRFNRQRPPDRRVAIYGIDLLGFPMALEKLAGQDETGSAGKQLKECLNPYLDNPMLYPAALRQQAPSCAAAAAALREELHKTTGAFSVEQRMRIVANAEAYYRAMADSAVAAWNRRVAHFAETLDRLSAVHGPNARGIVWAHNTHVGDARATQMLGRGMQSLGELLRVRYGEEALLLVGSATYRGSVLAGREWGAPVEVLPLPPAQWGSLEELMHLTGRTVAYWIFTAADGRRGPLTAPCAQRAVGVIYQPEFDGRDNYLATILPKRYNALIYVDTTMALDGYGVPFLSQPD